MQNIEGTLKSINGNKDVFGNTAPFNSDHIWPKSKGGTDAKINKLKLSKKSNDEKKDKTKGTINEIRFSVEKQTTPVDSSGNQTIYGVLYVKKNEKWYEVVNG